MILSKTSSELFLLPLVPGGFRFKFLFFQKFVHLSAKPGAGGDGVAGVRGGRVPGHRPGDSARHCTVPEGQGGGVLPGQVPRLLLLSGLALCVNILTQDETRPRFGISIKTSGAPEAVQL